MKPDIVPRRYCLGSALLVPASDWVRFKADTVQSHVPSSAGLC